MAEGKKVAQAGIDIGQSLNLAGSKNIGSKMKFPITAVLYTYDDVPT